MEPRLTLTIGGVIHAGWKSAAVQLSMERLAGGFRLGVTDKWGEAEPRPIKPGEKAALAVDGETLVTGYVDQVRPSYRAQSHETRVEGRDRAGDLVDCAALHDPDEWNGRDALQLAKILCDPFSIATIAAVPVGTAIPKFKINTGETAFSAIERACRQRALLPLSDGLGGLVLTRAAKTRSVGAIIERDNVISAAGEFSDRRRYSEYIVRGDSQGSDQGWGEALEVEGRATDPAMGRYRPSLILADSQVDQDGAQLRATWAASIAAGRARRAVYTVQGWHHGSGLWRPNTLVRVEDPWLGIEGDMLLATIGLIRDQQGTRAELHVVHPKAFDLIELPEDVDEEPGW